MAIDTRSLDQALAQLRATAALVQGKPAESAGESGGADFSLALKTAIDQVNQAQQQAQRIAEDFAVGKNDVNLQDVMIDLQKANLSFQQMVQVRNKLVTAYNDIMNMPV
jgi:flagellar hook-basal body complex protein FliE